MPKPVIAKKKELTYKQRAFVKHIIDNPKSSATEAAAQAYNLKTGNRHTAEVIASENLRKPEIVSALAEHNNLVENTIINTVNEYKNSDKIRERELAVDTSKWIHDKIHGKATQTVEQHITEVKLSLNLKDVTDK